MTQGAILIADDEELIRQVLAGALGEVGYAVETADSGTRAWARLQEHAFDLAFIDIRMPEPGGLDLLLRVQTAKIDTPIVIMTGQTTLSNAIEAMKRGAFDYLTKPFDLNEVKALAARALEARRLASQLDQPLLAVHGCNEQIIGRSPAMQEVYKTIGRVVKSDATVLIQGESGTGKELIARVIHHYSTRWRAPFVAINCSAIPVDLLESEFFGHERGAFTGAVERRSGKFEQASGERCSSMRSQTCRLRSRPKSCGCCKSASSPASAGGRRSRPTSASSPPPTRTLLRPSRSSAFAKTSTSACGWCQSRCHRCVSGGTTFLS